MNLELLCRLCSISNPNTRLDNIFVEDEQLKTILNLSSVDIFMTDICKIQILKDDVLPQNICNHCKSEIINFAQFIKKCRDSNEKLQNIFKNNDKMVHSENYIAPVWKKPHRRKYKIRILQKKYKDTDSESNKHDIESKKNEPLPIISDISNTMIKFDDINKNVDENDKNLIKLVFHISKIAKNQKLHEEIKRPHSDEPELSEKSSLNKKNDDEITNIDNFNDLVSSEDEIDFDIKNNTNKILETTNAYVCKICEVSLCSKSSLRVHQATHSSERPFECDKCDLKFKLKSHLIGHRRNIHEGLKKHCCKTCHKTFFGIAQLKIHMITHTKEYPHLCTLCGKRFSQQCYLRVHQKMHSGIKDLSCEFCEYTTGNQSAMKMHIKGVHEMDKKYQCAHCGLRFMYPSGLTEHMTIHTGVKKYQCTVCDKKFRTNSSLKEHMRIHSDEKPYKCRYCEKLFRIIGHRTVHERIHTGEKPYICVICSKGFQTRSNMNAHQKIHIKAQ